MVTALSCTQSAIVKYGYKGSRLARKNPLLCPGGVVSQESRTSIKTLEKVSWRQIGCLLQVHGLSLDLSGRDTEWCI